MKFIFVFLFCFSAFAMGPKDLGTNHPEFHDYEAVAFSGVRTYFRNFFQNSYVVNDLNGIKTIVVLDKNQNEILRVNAKVERAFSNNQFSESVIYAFPNGKVFDYRLKRNGPNLQPLNDLDLLMFKFQDDDQLSLYEISSKALGIIFHREKNDQQEKSYFNLVFMEYTIEIDTRVNENDVTRNYLYFYKYFPNPQSQLTVKAEMAQGSWGAIQYTYYGREMGAFEITAKDFFGAINEGAGPINSCVQIFPGVLSGIGFPTF